MTRSLPRAVLVALLLSTAATAAPPKSQTDAQRAYERGVQLYRAGQYEEAVKAFQDAYRASPQPALLFNMAQAYERLGNLEKAIEAYQGYLAGGPNDREQVETTILRLKRTLEERNFQQLRIRSLPTDATVEIDGTPRGKTPHEERLAIGEHQLTLTLEGHQPAKRTVVLTPSAAVELEVTLLPVPKPEEPKKLWTWVALGTGAAAVATGGVLGYLARQDSQTMYDSIHDAAAVQRLHDGARNKAIAANVLYGVGGALGVAGGALFFFEGRF